MKCLASAHKTIHPAVGEHGGAERVSKEYHNERGKQMIDNTFWMDFSIADKFGIEAVKDTYNRAFNEWKSDYEYLTALVIILNWKIWEHYEKGNEEFARLYDSYWREAEDYAYNNLEGKELEYFWRETD